MAHKKKGSVGYIYYKTFHDPTNDRIMKAIKKRGFDVVRLPVEDQVELGVLEDKTKDCGVVFNNAVFEPIEFESIEITKTLEEFGKRVVNASRCLFYEDDRWLFYQICLEHNIPTPKTYFVPKERRFDSSTIRSVLADRPLVLKAIFSDNGECVYKVNDYSGFQKKLHMIMRKNPASPVVAQEFVPNNNRSFRATLVGYKVAQFVEKIGTNWKQTGNGKKERFRTLKIDSRTRKLCERSARIFGMDICGLDMLNHDGKWYVIEANSCPALDFIYADEKRLVNLIADYLCSLCKRR
jgi:ribosomal protein S6--L-glutamate ligase